MSYSSSWSSSSTSAAEGSTHNEWHRSPREASPPVTSSPPASTDASQVSSTVGTTKKTGRIGGTYREDPHVVQLMHAKWARLQAQHHQDLTGSATSTCDATAERTVQPWQDSSGRLPDPYAYFFVPTLATLPTETSPPCPTSASSPTDPRTPQYTHASTEAPSTHATQVLPHVARRLAMAEEAARHSPPLAPLEFAGARPDDAVVASSSRIAAVPPCRSCTASPVTRAEPERVLAPPLVPVSTVMKDGEAQAPDVSDEAARRGHGGGGVDDEDSREARRTRRAARDRRDTHFPPSRVRSGVAVPAEYVAVPHLPTRASPPRLSRSTAWPPSSALSTSTAAQQDAQSSRRPRHRGWRWLFPRPLSPTERDGGGESVDSTTALLYHHTSASADESEGAEARPTGWRRFFQWTRTEPEATTHDRHFASRRSPPLHTRETSRVHLAHESEESEDDDEEEEEEEEDDDELRMMMRGTTLGLCCCNPSANLLFGIQETNATEGDDDGDDDAAAADEEDEEGDEDHLAGSPRHVLSEGTRLLHAHRASPASLYLLYSPTTTTATTTTTTTTSTTKATAATAAVSPSRVCPVSLASRHLDWTATEAVPATTTTTTPPPPLISSRTHTSTDIATSLDASGVSLSAPGGSGGRRHCVARSRRACTRALRRTWRYMNVFATSDSVSDHGVDNDTSEQDGAAEPIHVRPHTADRTPPPPALSSLLYAPSPPSSQRHGLIRTRSRDVRRHRARRHRPDRALREPELPTVARWYCLLNYAAAALTGLAVLILLWSTYASSLARQRLAGQYDIRDGTVCHTLTFTERLRPDLSFSVACFLVNSYFLVWCALRAVRLESPGLLLGHALLAVIELSRIAYFVLYVAGRYLVKTSSSTDVDNKGHVSLGTVRGHWAMGHADVEKPRMTPLGRAGNLLLALAAVLLIISVFLAVPVRRAFGWRSFLHGWTQPETLRLRRRFTYFQTCLQLDGVVTLNVALALVFLLDKPLDQLLNALSLCVTWLMLMFLPPLLYRASAGLRYAVVMSMAAAVFGVSLAFYAYVVVRNLRAYTFDTVTDSSDDLHRDPRKSPCYTGQLASCLIHQDMVVVPHDNKTSTVRDDVVRGPQAGGMSCGASAWVNGSSTFLPTQSRQGELLELFLCPIDTCFATQGDLYVDRFHRCCARYGVCRLKDAFRTYGVLLVLFLTLTLVVVRVALVWLSWSRAKHADDEAIVALRARRRRRRPPAESPPFDVVESGLRGTTPANVTHTTSNGVH